MNPAEFPEQTGVLGGHPTAFGEPVSDLPVYQGPQGTVSCWKPTWPERLMILLGCPVWLHFLWAQAHPPVAVSIEPTIFGEGEEDLASAGEAF